MDGRNRGKKHYLVVIAEGVGGAVEIAEYIERKDRCENESNNTWPYTTWW